MEISIKNATLLCAILLTGLSAGLFYAWTVSVIPGTKRIADANYLETMQSINRAILNPAFYLIFFGSLILMIISSVQHYSHSNPIFWLVLLATLIYLIGTFGVTVFGNVPLNEGLNKIELSKLSQEELTQARQSFEGSWNRLHMIRTVFSVLSFLTMLLSVFVSQSSNE